MVYKIILTCISLCTMVFNGWILYTVSGKKNFVLSPALLFFMLYFVFYYIGTFILFLGMYPGNHLLFAFFNNKGHLLKVSLGILFFSLGVLFGSNFLKFKPTLEITSFKYRVRFCKNDLIGFNLLFDIVLILISIVVIVNLFLVYGIPAFGKVKYFEFSPNSGYAMGFLKDVLPATTLILFFSSYTGYNNAKRGRRPMGVIFWLVCVIFMFLQGARIYLMEFFLWTFVIISIFSSSISIRNILKIPLIGFFFFSVISLIRYSQLSQHVDIYSAIRLYVQAALIDRIFISECVVLNFILEYFPHYYDFFMGKTFVDYIVSDKTLPYWLFEQTRSLLMFPFTFHKYANVPVSFYGEFWLNFGYLSLFVMFMWGFILQSFFIWTIRQKSFTLTKVVIIAILWSWLGRSVELGIYPVTRKLIYFLFMLICFRFLLGLECLYKKVYRRKLRDNK